MVVNIIAFIFSDQASRATVLAGALLGGFLVDAVVDWAKYRRTKG
ncbi:hypothetical protein [Saccharothrix coeruleofusca]|nr:hypothetical protein [Saccharothrix coeruleofusca]MBP2336464.1 hypothetical protein [Saccharothrix coeruleofusca]